MKTHYFLPRHVHFCYRGDAAVFLDLRQDEYFFVNGATLDTLRAIEHSHEMASSAAEAQRRTIEDLVTAGLLTTRRDLGKDVIPTTTVTPSDLLINPIVEETDIDRHDISRFYRACLTAWVLLRTRSIESIIRRVQRRKSRLATACPLDLEAARNHTATFKKLRPFAPFDYLCLFDSLALLEFLAAFDIFPTWVFAIRLEPWSAHCWLQDGTYSFNEEIEHAANYTPVLAV